jgi:hypothetical protein
MNVAALAVTLAIAAAPVDASEASASAPLTLRSKAAVSAVLAAPRAAAPFRVSPGPELDLLPESSDPRLGHKHWSCDGESSLCYDPGSRRVIYKPARALMPEIPGLRRENISVKRDRIIFKYSF